MSRLFYHTCQDNLGNLLFDVSGTMRVAGTGTLATIYGDEALSVILPNPMTNHPSFGSFKCFLPVGDYDFYMSKAGYTFETLTGVQGYGTMAQENTHAVSALTVVGTTYLQGAVGIQTTPAAPNALVVGPGTVLTQPVGIGITPANDFHVGVVSYFSSPVGIGTTPGAPNALVVGPGTVLTQPVGIGITPTSPFHVGVDTRFNTPVGIGTNPVGGQALVVSSGCILTPYVGIGITPFYPFHVNALARFDQPLAIGPVGPGGGVELAIAYDRSGSQCIQIRPSADTGPGAAVQFTNAALGTVGTIVTTATTTTYNTTSDGRLKEAVEPLTGALAVVRALNPVAFRWRLDGSPGRGLLAQEVAEVVDGVITGEDGAVDDAGNIQPMQIDYSKLVPYLIGSIKELCEQVQVLQAQLAAVGA